MTGKLDEGYFLEKKEFALESLSLVTQRVSDASAAIAATSYDIPNLVNANEIHQLLKDAAHSLKGARRDFEKTRWAATSTSLEFEEWLTQEGCAELRLG